MVSRGVGSDKDVSELYRMIHEGKLVWGFNAIASRGVVDSTIGVVPGLLLLVHAHGGLQGGR